MKKSLISIVVVLAMLLSMTCGVFADDTLSSYLAQTYGNGSVPTRSVNVGVNMQGKKSADANYSDEFTRATARRLSLSILRLTCLWTP